MAQTIRILIADDHAIVRQGLRTLISSEEGLELVDEAANGSEAVEKVLRLRPDVILLDLVMPGKSGLEAIIEIKQSFPEARILVLTSFTEDDKVFSAIKAGALGYLLKDTLPDELLKSIQAIYRGEPSMSPAIARKLMREISQPSNLPPADEPLTEREIEVLKLLALGLANQDIAARLTISEWTVRTHIRNILNKLHLANRLQAALYAVREGLVKPDIN